MKRNIRKSISGLNRYKEIVKVFVKYGFSDITSKLSSALLPVISKNSLSTQGKNLNTLSTPIRLRMAFEELGATFIKLGQMLSLRQDIIPEEFIFEFTKLQDSVQQDDLSEIKILLAKEFNKPITEAFLEFDETPIASASIGQVHKARLNTGEEVAVKILHPGIEDKIKIDIEILTDIAKLLVLYVPESQLYDPVGIVKEFGRSIKNELNLVNEGRNIDIFRYYMKDDITIKTPLVYWDYTTEKVLVTEFIYGIKISEIQLMDESNIDRKQVAENGAKALLKQIFECGFFHADTHPGNLFVLPGNIIAPIDFGNVGRIDEKMRNGLLNIVKGAVDKDTNKIVREIIHIGLIDDDIDLRGLQRDIMEILDHYYGMSLNRLNVVEIINEFLGIVRLNKIKLPPDTVVMARALVIYESVGRKLNPEFNMVELTEPYIKQAILQRINPISNYRSFIQYFENNIDSLINLPDNLQSILNKILKDKLKITLHHDGLEKLTKGIERSSNRLSFSLVIASLIIGSSFIMQVSKGPILFGYPIFGVVGYIIAIVLGVWLLIGIMKSGKL
jgi:ubiquinone biosynthesis protein